jgi:nucleoside-diphosphate-sugar epimerase
VRGAVRSLSKKKSHPQGIHAVEIGSIDSNTEWEPVLEGIDTVVHLAARVHVMDESISDPINAYRNINVAGTRHLAHIAGTKGVRRFILTSSVKVNGEGRLSPYDEDDRPAPSDPYGISKYEAEQALREVADKTGLEIVILRPPLVYGPGVKANFLRLLKIVDRGIPLPLANVKNNRSMIFLKNLIDAIVMCIINPCAAGQLYLLSDGRDLSTPELIRKVAVAMGKKPKLFPFPPFLLRFFAKMIGKSANVYRLLDSLVVNNTKIRTDLDWTPRFTVDEGLMETVNWYLHEFG